LEFHCGRQIPLLHIGNICVLPADDIERAHSIVRTRLAQAGERRLAWLLIETSRWTQRYRLATVVGVLAADCSSEQLTNQNWYSAC